MFIEEWIYQKLLREWVCSQISLRVTSYRNEIKFYTIRAARFEKTDQELKAYDMPITKIIEENSIKEVADSIDNEIMVNFWIK